MKNIDFDLSQTNSILNKNNTFLSIITAAVNSNEADLKGPVFTKEPLNRIDFSNSTGAVVECRASGNPPPEIIWIRSDGTAVGDVPGLRQVLSNGNLVFPPFRAEDYRQEVHAQVYACLAKNPIGSIISRDVHVRAGKLKSLLFKLLHSSILIGRPTMIIY